MMSLHGPENLSAALPRLAAETELQKMLTDEKMRAEQHKNHYQALKTEHTRLQDEYRSLQDELRSTIEESRLVQEKYKSLMEQVRQELTKKHQECEELKTKVVTEQRLEVLRIQLNDEIEAPYRQKMAQLNEESDSYRTEYNKLKYEYSFLKAEYEHEKNEHAQIVEELKLRHEAEVTNLRKERETILARSQTETNADTQRVRPLQRENAQLHLKVKSLLNELEEIRAQREHQGLQSDHVTRLQTKQLAEHAANIKALETERESLKLQLENLQREFSTTTDLHTSLTSRVHELEKDNLVLKNKTEEVVHQSKVDLTSLKMDMLRERGELERQRDRLANEIEDLKCQVDIAQSSMDAQAHALIEKEREAAKRVQAACEQEWTKLHKVENEKLELEAKLQEIERRKIDEETRRQADKEAVEERIRQVVDTKDEAEKETLVLRTKLQHQDSLMEHLERERSENSDLKSRLHRLETEVHSYVRHEQEMVEMNAQLKSQLDRAQDDLRTTRDTLTHSQNLTERTVAEHRVTWTEEKMNLERRVDEQDDQLTQLHQRIVIMTNTHKKKKKGYSKVVSKLKDKLTLTTAKLEEMEIERDALKKSVPPQQHTRLKKQLNDLLRRHREFRTLMSSANPGLDLSAGSGNLDTTPCLGFISDLEPRAEKELELLKERLDLLDDNQRQQMDELRTITRVISPIRDVENKDHETEKGDESC